MQSCEGGFETRSGGFLKPIDCFIKLSDCFLNLSSVSKNCHGVLEAVSGVSNLENSFYLNPETSSQKPVTGCFSKPRDGFSKPRTPSKNLSPLSLKAKQNKQQQNSNISTTYLKPKPAAVTVIAKRLPRRKAVAAWAANAAKKPGAGIYY
jgi:hypothetical protein